MLLYPNLVPESPVVEFGPLAKNARKRMTSQFPTEKGAFRVPQRTISSSKANWRSAKLDCFFEDVPQRYDSDLSRI